MGESDLSLPGSQAEEPSPHANLLLAAKGGGLIFFGRLFEYGSRFVFGLIVARVLGAEGLGLYTLGVTTAVLLSAVARLGLSEGLIRYLPPALRKGDESRVWGTLQVSIALTVAASIVLAAVLLGLSGFLAVELFRQPEATSALRWASFIIPLVALGRLLLAATRGFQRMEYQLYGESILFNVSRLALTILFLAVGLSVSGALAAYALAWLLVDMMMLYVMNRLFPLRRPLNPAQRNVRELLSFSVPVCLTQVTIQLRGTFGLVLLGIFGTLASIGVYSAAVSVQAIGGMLLAASDLVARPIISDLYHRGDMEQLSQLYQTLTRWATSFLLPYFITIVLFGTPILALLGEDYTGGAPVLVIVSVATLVGAVTGLCSAVIVMTGHSKLSLANTLATVALYVVLSSLLIPRYDLLGAALATTLASVTINILRLFQVHWIADLWPWNRVIVKPLIACLAALAAGWLAGTVFPADNHLLYLILDVAILWLVYAAVTLLLGLSAEDRFVLSQTKRRFNRMLA